MHRREAENPREPKSEPKSVLDRLLQRFTPRRREHFFSQARRDSLENPASPPNLVFNPRFGAQSAVNLHSPESLHYSPPHEQFPPPGPNVFNPVLISPRSPQLNSPESQLNSDAEVSDEEVFDAEVTDAEDTEESENDEMSSANMPPIFRGIRSQCVEAWFRHLDLWIATQRIMTERAKISSAALLFQDAALHFYNGLVIVDGDPGEGEIATYADFKARVIDRFRREPGTNWQELALLHSMKQQQGQSTEAFIAEIINKGNAARASEEQMRTAALAGLRDDIKSVLIHHEITSLEDISRWGVLAESVQGSDVNGTVKRLETVIEQLQTRPLVAPETLPGPTSQCQPQVSGRGRGGFSRGGFQGNQRGQRGSWQSATRRSGNYNNNNNNNYDRMSNCNKCNREHGPICPAQNAICRVCGRVGHFAVKCYRRNNMNSTQNFQGFQSSPNPWSNNQSGRGNNYRNASNRSNQYQNQYYQNIGPMDQYTPY